MTLAMRDPGGRRHCAAETGHGVAEMPPPLDTPPADPHRGGMIVNCAAYADGRRVGDFCIEEVGAVAAREGQFVWVGLHEPSEDILRDVQRQFGLHDLAIEDAHCAHQRPKFEVYGDAIFLVLHTAQLVEGEIRYGETHVFAGKGYVVSVRHGASLSYAAVRKRCECTPALLARGESFVLYALMDFVVDNYFPIIDQMAAEVERIEEGVFKEASFRLNVERIYELRRDLLRLHHVVAPLLEVCNRIVRPGVPMIDPGMHLYFRDVYDHVIRVDEKIAGLREVVTSVLEASLMLASARQNEVTKKLAGWAAILAVPTAIAGMYGMNFENMPELKWQYGYFVVWGVIAMLCGYLYYRFKRTGWL
jgi:magnesium transporter